MDRNRQYYRKGYRPRHESNIQNSTPQRMYSDCQLVSVYDESGKVVYKVQSASNQRNPINPLVSPYQPLEVVGYPRPSYSTIKSHNYQMRSRRPPNDRVQYMEPCIEENDELVQTGTRTQGTNTPQGWGFHLQYLKQADRERRTASGDMASEHSYRPHPLYLKKRIIPGFLHKTPNQELREQQMAALTSSTSTRIIGTTSRSESQFSDERTSGLKIQISRAVETEQQFGVIRKKPFQMIRRRPMFPENFDHL